MSMNAPLTATNVGKAYNGQFVLRDASLTLKDGEIFGLIGLNGAGKTTLIKTVLDLIRSEEGSVMLYDLPSHNPQARKRLSYLPEKFQPSRYLRGYEYLELFIPMTQNAVH